MWFLSLENPFNSLLIKFGIVIISCPKDTVRRGLFTGSRLLIDHYFPSIKNIAIAAEPIPKKVIHKIILESTPLLYSPMILSFADIFIIRKMRGTAATPFKTAE